MGVFTQCNTTQQLKMSELMAHENMDGPQTCYTKWKVAWKFCICFHLWATTSIGKTIKTKAFWTDLTVQRFRLEHEGRKC